MIWRPTFETAGKILATEGFVGGDLTTPLVLLFCHFQSGYAQVDVLKMPHFSAQCFLAMAEAFRTARRDRQQEG